MKFTVLAPDETHFSAGVTCLHLLMRYLKELGHEVYHANYQRHRNHNIFGTLIAPEVVDGIEIPHVRWCLNKPGLLGGPKTYPPGTRVFHYSPPLEESARAASPDGTSTEFMMGCLDIPPRFAARQFDLWYRGKYTGEVGTPAPFQLQLTRSWPPTKEEYWNLMHRAISLYSYDDFSAVNLEAHLTGVKVKVWNGTEFVKFEPPEFADRLLLNHETNLASVEKFVSELTTF